MGNCGSAKQKPGVAKNTAPPQKLERPTAQTPKQQPDDNLPIETEEEGLIEQPNQSASATKGLAFATESPLAILDEGQGKGQTREFLILRGQANLALRRAMEMDGNDVVQRAAI